MEVADPLEVPQCLRSDPSLQYPAFPTLIGEHPLLISKTTDGNAMVTNFRFCVCERRLFINIPLMMVGELLVNEANKRLRIGCKDGSTYSCTFATAEDCQSCMSMLREKTGPPQSTEDLFAYRFYALAMYKRSMRSTLTKIEEENILLCQTVNPEFGYNFDMEVERLGFDLRSRKSWRISQANVNFEFCPTYPKLHVIPAAVCDDKLKVSLDFRALKRFPSVVWRDKRTGMVLIRSSQPLSSFLGVSYFTNQSDVLLIDEIVNACNRDRVAVSQDEHKRSGHPLPADMVNSICDPDNGQSNSCDTDPVKDSEAQRSPACDISDGTSCHGASNGTFNCGDSNIPKKLAIVDCRSLAGVWGNSFKGGGTEDEAVYKCNIIHLDLANIHTVRDSFCKLRALCHAYVEGTFYKSLSGCMWLTYISALLRGANIVVELMHVMKRPVLVHCSDGWDRTSQIVSLSELMMDAYYRTLKGFQVLVEREWLHFGHKFGERGGHDPCCTDTNQISPIFLQFLDCVYQLTLQYPAEFQFNETYLVKLLQHSQACLFGNFLHNCQKEREYCQQKTASVWSLLRPDKLQFVNSLYRPSDQVLTAKFSEHDVVLWKSVYMAGRSPLPYAGQTDFYRDCSPAAGGDGDVITAAADGTPGSKSMDDLMEVSTINGHHNLNSSIAQSSEIAAAAPSTTDMHSELTSSQLLHFLKHSPPLNAAPTLLGQSEENFEGSSKGVDCCPSASIEHSCHVKKSLCSSSDVGLQLEATATQEICNTISLQDIPGDIPWGSSEQVGLNGPGSEAQQSNEPKCIHEIGDIYLDEADPASQSSPLPSSGVFCRPTELTGSRNGQTLCCDQLVSSVNIQMLTSGKIPSVDNSAGSFVPEKVNYFTLVKSISMDSVFSIASIDGSDSSFFPEKANNCTLNRSKSTECPASIKIVSNGINNFIPENPNNCTLNRSRSMESPASIASVDDITNNLIPETAIYCTLNQSKSMENLVVSVSGGINNSIPEKVNNCTLNRSKSTESSVTGVINCINNYIPEKANNCTLNRSKSTESSVVSVINCINNYIPEKAKNCTLNRSKSTESPPSVASVDDSIRNLIPEKVNNCTIDCSKSTKNAAPVASVDNSVDNSIPGKVYSSILIKSRSMESIASAMSVDDYLNNFIPGKVTSCTLIRSKSMDIHHSITSFSYNTASSREPAISGYKSKQRPLLEHSAFFRRLNVEQIKDIDIRSMVTRIRHLNDRSWCSEKSTRDLSATSADHIPRKLPNIPGVKSNQLAHPCSDKMGDDDQLEGCILGTGYVNGDMFSSSSLDSLEVSDIDHIRADTDAVEVDTLKDQVETLYSKSLDVSIRFERMSLSSPKNGDSYPSNIMSTLARAASGASRDFSVCSCSCRSRWSDSDRKSHASGGDVVARRLLRSTVATSTTDISDSHIGQPSPSRLEIPSTDQPLSIRQHIDIDGLTLFSDKKQDWLTQLLEKKDRKILELEHHLTQVRKFLKKLKGCSCQQMQLHDTPFADLDDTNGGGLHSLGQFSNTASDVSWDTGRETEAEGMLMVPDGTVASCAGCDVQFHLYKCKHHSCNCGKVVCRLCSNYLPVGSNQSLNRPEMVCRHCYSHLLQLSPGASSDDRFHTVIADG